MSHLDNISTSQKPSELLDFTWLLRIILKNWYWLALSILVSATVAYLYIRYTIPIYLVEGSVLIKEEENGLSSLFDESSFLSLSSKSDVADEVFILNSKDLITDAVSQLGLNVVVRLDGEVKDVDLYGQSPVDCKIEQLSDEAFQTKFSVEFSLSITDQNTYFISDGDEFETESTFGELLDTPYGQFTITLNDSLDFNMEDYEGKVYLMEVSPDFVAVQKYVKNLVIEQGDAAKSSVVIFSMQEEAPQRAKDLITKIIEIYNKNANEDKSSTANNTLRFIDERLQVLAKQLSVVEKDVQTYKEAQDIVVESNTKVNLLLEEYNEYNKTIDKLTIQKSIIEYIREYIESSTTQYELIPINIGEGSETLSKLALELNQLINERNSQLKVFNEQHPTIENLDAQINSLRSNIRTSINSLLKDVNNQLSRLNARSEEFSKQLESTPRKERELLEIKREQYIKENLFLFLLQKREETAVELAATSNQARVIDMPTLKSIRPESPKKALVVFACLFMGVSITLLAVVLRDYLDDTVRSVDDIKKLTDIPILGVVAESTKETSIVVEKGSRSSVAEMFRLIRTNMQFTLAGSSGNADESKVIMLTSSMSGEGKSFISINLAMSFALTEKKVVLLGLDLRKPKVGLYLNAGDSDTTTLGLSSYLIGASSVDEIIKKYEPNENFHYILSGPIPPNPAELLLNGKLDELIGILKESYDIIIIDTPPVGLVADSLLIKNIDSTIYVTRQYYTKGGQIGIIQGLHQENKLNNCSIILNGVKKDGTGLGYGYNSGYGYGYYYGDSNYYIEED